MAEYGPTALPPGANDGGDGSSIRTATWVVGSDKNARSFFVKQDSTFVRCNLANALDFNDMNYHVFDPPTNRRIKFVWKGPGRPQFQAFAHQYWEIQQEEQDSLARGDRLPGEDLSEDAEEEYDIAGDAVFDHIERLPIQPTHQINSASSPPSSSRNFSSSPPSGGYGRGSPSTPRGRGPTSQPGSGRDSSGRGSGTPRGRGSGGSGGSGQDQGSPKSPMSPYFDKSKGPGGGSPGIGTV
ncbi:hypothetical protein GT037_000344 [Alternaria burnsii]|uniref:Uncharacterized protein n=1 Tax=Alternaria burnsii TaxID=1187904 RepID=A0A8H7EMN5_9PLEO|nr:uncharacterized protein GT037_000344 [Alternaria burnsii]KAF7681368.1 hypothetical protein GT037_000344 [Alternaria burnsii]